MSEAKFYHFSANGLVSGVASADDAIAASDEGGFMWLKYYKPTKQELDYLIDKLGIHPLSVEDCLDKKQIPKIEHFPSNTFIIFNAFSFIEKTLHIDEVDFFIGKNFIITVSGHNSDLRKPLANIESMLSKGSIIAKGGPAFLLHIIMDYLVDQKFEAFDALEDDLEAAEDGVIDNPAQFNPKELMRLRKDLLHLRKRLFHEREILVKICRLDCPFITEKALFHYRDVYDHLAKIFELSESFREIVTNLMELYTSLLNNLMTKASNETNASVRRLTLITTVFMPLTLLASIGGMSEWSMMTGPENWRITYPLFMLGMLVIGGLNFILLRILEKRGRFKQIE